MSEYTEQAKKFLADCNADMTIKYLETTENESWGDKEPRDKYYVVIETPKGSMNLTFWDSIVNTEKNHFCKSERREWIKPSEYDILACLQKYDVGTIDDFVSDFGYEVNEWADVKRIEATYNAVVKEYNGICRCFAPKQIEAMQEIQ